MIFRACYLLRIRVKTILRKDSRIEKVGMMNGNRFQEFFSRLRRQFRQFIYMIRKDLESLLDWFRCGEVNTCGL